MSLQNVKWIHVEKDEEEDVLNTLVTHHPHFIILGQIGSGKTTLAQRILDLVNKSEYISCMSHTEELKIDYTRLPAMPTIIRTVVGEIRTIEDIYQLQHLMMLDMPILCTAHSHNVSLSSQFPQHIHDLKAVLALHDVEYKTLTRPKVFIKTFRTQDAKWLFQYHII